MNARTLRRAAAACLLGFGLAGCMSYRLDRMPAVRDLPAPPPPDRRVTATYTMHTLAGSDYQFTPSEVQSMGMQQTGLDLAGILTSTGWFRSVEPLGGGAKAAGTTTPDAGADAGANAGADAGANKGAGEAAAADGAWRPAGAEGDLHLECVLTVRGNDFVLLASAMTLFVIPTWRTTTYELIVEARRADGTWKRYEYSDSTRDIHWLPMILVMSFRPWGEAYGELRRNMYRTLVSDLLADGMLQPVVAAR